MRRHIRKRADLVDIKILNKWCPGCLKWKAKTMFGKDGTRLNSWCKECDNAYQRAYRKDPKHRQKLLERDINRKLFKHYGITIEDYNRLLEQQGGVCAICGRPPVSKRRFHVDHNHKTGVVRGLLCSGCNTAVGGVHEDTNVLQKMIAYLNEKAAPTDPNPPIDTQ
jgi:hypothetical protein